LQSSREQLQCIRLTSAELSEVAAPLGGTAVGIGAGQLVKGGLLVDDLVAVDLQEQLGLLLGAGDVRLAPRAGTPAALVLHQQMEALHLVGGISPGRGSGAGAGSAAATFLGRFRGLVPLRFLGVHIQVIAQTCKMATF